TSNLWKNRCRKFPTIGKFEPSFANSPTIATQKNVTANEKPRLIQQARIETLRDSMKSVLVIDIGNTSISAGVYRGGKISRVTRLEEKENSSESRNKLVRNLLRGKIHDAAVIASVVPRTNEAWRKTLADFGDQKIVWLSHTTDIGVQITYPKPETI